VFALARAERRRFDPALRSLGFPLLGARCGGLHPATCFAWIWTSLEREILDDCAWEIHFITRYRPAADLIIARLAEAGAIFELPGQAG